MRKCLSCKMLLLRKWVVCPWCGTKVVASANVAPTRKGISKKLCIGLCLSSALVIIVVIMNIYLTRYESIVKYDNPALPEWDSDGPADRVLAGTISHDDDEIVITNNSKQDWTQTTVSVEAYSKGCTYGQYYDDCGYENDPGTIRAGTTIIIGLGDLKHEPASMESGDMAGVSEITIEAILPGDQSNFLHPGKHKGELTKDFQPTHRQVVGE